MVGAGTAEVDCRDRDAESAAASAAVAWVCRQRGTFSPKNTTSGLMMPSQRGQLGTSNKLKSRPSRSASPSGASGACRPVQPALRSSR
jgi:hypothetical protein